MPVKPIIVGVDGSPEAVRAAAVAEQVARRLSAGCVFVYAAPEPWPAGLAPIAMLPETYDGVRRHLLEGLRRELPGIRDDALTIRIGRPGDVLVREAGERDAALVVVGGRHHGALARSFGGSTAHYLARALDVPLLVVSAETRAVRRVLAAVDLSEAGEPTLALAARYAQLLDAPLRALHVVEPAKFPIIVPLSIDEAELERRSRAAFERIIAAVPAAATAERAVAHGVAAEAIAEAAAEWHADLLVVGSHGKGWAHRMLIGSTAERLLNLLPTSVLVVPITRVTRSRRPRVARVRRQRRKGRSPRGTIVV